MGDLLYLKVPHSKVSKWTKNQQPGCIAVLYLERMQRSSQNPAGLRLAGCDWNAWQVYPINNGRFGAGKAGCGKEELPTALYTSWTRASHSRTRILPCIIPSKSTSLPTTFIDSKYGPLIWALPSFLSMLGLILDFKDFSRDP